ncbi:MAG: hypothetical protein JG762_836 [Deferribacteraceae bacterium]|jgi:type IV pilus assembly protein PilY1|nr:hypothetical protein [Deferribacteraceae bacterium]
MIKRIIFSIFFMLFITQHISATTQYDATPPFITKGVKPNLLLILDNSGSMNEFAYKSDTVSRSYNSDCSNSSSSYVGYQDNETYAGYFEPDIRYSYNSDGKYFYKNDNGEWSGNFLNWLTTRRIDAVKKVLTGGKYIKDNGNTLLLGTDLDRDQRKILENDATSVTNLDNNSAYFYFYNDNDNGSIFFEMRPAIKKDGCWIIEGTPSTFRFAIKVNSDPSGLIQKTYKKVRYGLMNFNTDEGGYIVNYFGDNITNIIENINNLTPKTWTPLAETLFEASKYLRAQSSKFNSNVNYSSSDPIDYPCRRNYIIVLTDGESTQDKNVPAIDSENWNKKSFYKLISDYEGTSLSNPLNNSNGTWDLVPVAYWMHTTDLRSDFSLSQIANIFTVFAFDDSENAKKLLKLTAKYGGFKNSQYDNEPTTEEYDNNQDGIPDNYFEAKSPDTLIHSLEQAVNLILADSSSGTGLGIAFDTKHVNRVDGILQAVFYPLLDDGDKEVDWAGNLFKYDLKNISESGRIWEAGEKLVATYDRTIKYLDNSSLVNFDSSDDTLKSLVCGSSDTACENEFDNITKFIKGEQVEGYRNITYTNDNKTWKLGDIIHSTPAVASYNNIYYVFTGANDGQLHVFDYSSGDEVMSFIPKNVLPYLKYLKDPNYTHMYTVDGEPYIYNIYGIDNKTVEKKILIGSMGFGGATGTAGDSGEIITPPLETCPSEDNCVGRSSYFALDITSSSPSGWKVLWEYTHPKLGFTTSGPAVIKRGDKYYVAFANGPTKYNGASEYSLRVFVLNLVSGEELMVKDLNINNAFGGRLYTNGLDVNNDGDTDYFFIGYTNYSGSLSTLDDDDPTNDPVGHGGLIKVYTGGAPDSWDFNNNYFNIAQNPVTAKIGTMMCFGKPYIYFGTGKFFTNIDDGGGSSSQPNAIYGIPFGCSADGSCEATSINSAHAVDDNDPIPCDEIGNVKANKGGWVIYLDDQDLANGRLRERVYTDPGLADKYEFVVMNSGIPTSDVCNYGGLTKIYVRNCATGEILTDYSCPDYKKEVPPLDIIITTTTGIKEITGEESNPEIDTSGLPSRSSPLILLKKYISKTLLWLEK